MCPSDRVFSQATAARSDIRSAFDILDSDRDGKISGEDLRAFYAGVPNSSGFTGDGEDIVGAMIQAADLNKDGFVEYEEFERVLNGHERKMLGPCFGDLMEDVFKMMDKDRDGRLSLEDLKSYMEGAGFAASDDEIREMIRLAGGDEIRGVSFDGLLNVFGIV